VFEELHGFESDKALAEHLKWATAVPRVPEGADRRPERASGAGQNPAEGVNS